MAIFRCHMLLTLLIGDKQAWRDLVEIDIMVYGIPSHLFVTKQQSCFIVLSDFRYTLLISLLSVLLEYLDQFKPFVGQCMGMN